MARRPAVTLLLLATERTVRADLADGPRFEPVTTRSFPAGVQDDPVIRTASALSAGGRVGRSVWILWERAWLQTVELPAAAVEGLEPAALSRSLAFEAEPLSAISAGDSALSAVSVRVLPVVVSPGLTSTSSSGSFAALTSGSGIRSPSGVLNPSGILDPISPAPAAPVDPSSRRAFWLVQIAASVRDGLEHVVSQSGSRLAGVLHPAGLPWADWSATGSANPPTGPGPWARVEVWDQLSVFLWHRGGSADGDADPLSVRVISARAGSAHWRSELSALLSMVQENHQELPTVGWMGRGPPPSLSTAAGTPVNWREQSLTSDAPPSDWLRAWAAVLTQEQSRASSRVPLVPLPRRSSELPRYLLVGAAALLLVGGLCFVHAQGLSEQAARLRSEADQLETTRRAEAVSRNRAMPVNTAAEEMKLKEEIAKLQRAVAETAQNDRELAQQESRALALADEVRQRREQTRAARFGQRAGVPALLTLLAEIDAQTARAPWQLVIVSVQTETSGESRLIGACRERRDADQFAELLKKRLEPSGWTVTDFEKERRDTDVGEVQYPYVFTVRLRPPALRWEMSARTTESPVPAGREPELAENLSLLPVGEPSIKPPPPPPPLPPAPPPAAEPPRSDAHHPGGRL